MSLKVEVLDKLSALVTAAFGLVAALAWNAAIQKAFALYVQPRFGDTGEVQALAIYALLVTIVAVLFTIWVARATSRAKNMHFTFRSRHLGPHVDEPPMEPPRGGPGT